jgi:hypothetical protein
MAGGGMPKACSARPRRQRDPVRRNQTIAPEGHWTELEGRRHRAAPPPLSSNEVRDKLTRLTGTYALEDKGG